MCLSERMSMTAIIPKRQVGKMKRNPCIIAICVYHLLCFSSLIRTEAVVTSKQTAKVGNES